MAFPYERAFFENERWNVARTVLDFGAGNCAYAGVLADQYPGKAFTCIEHDDAMRTLAEASGRSVSLKRDMSEVADASQEFAILRLVLLHVADRPTVYDHISRALKPNSTVLVLDADDEHFFISPPPPHFLAALGVIKGRSKDRVLKDRVAEELSPFGFQQLLHHRVLINSGTPIAKLQMYLYMKLTAEAALGGVRDINIEDELLCWYLSRSSYAQYGIFGSLFERRSQTI